MFLTAFSRLPVAAGSFYIFNKWRRVSSTLKTIKDSHISRLFKTLMISRALWEQHLTVTRSLVSLRFPAAQMQKCWQDPALADHPCAIRTAWAAAQGSLQKVWCGPAYTVPPYTAISIHVSPSWADSWCPRHLESHLPLISYLSSSPKGGPARFSGARLCRAQAKWSWGQSTHNQPAWGGRAARGTQIL